MLVLVGVAGMAFAARELARGDDALLSSSVVMFGCSLAIVVLSMWSIRAFRMLSGRDEPSELRIPLSTDRMNRLNKAQEFLPDPCPPGWSSPISPHGTVAWRIYVGDDVVSLSWVVRYSTGYRVHVTLAQKDGAPVGDRRAADIFAHYRGVNRFVELAQTPEKLVKELPGARTWIALPDEVAREAVRSAPLPPKAPEPIERPLNEHLLAVRKHLPPKLPVGWSVPLAITEEHEGWTDGAWMIETREAILIVAIVASQGRAKLSVTIFHPDQSVVNEAQAMRVLKHFRGIGEFVQTDIKDARDLPGARMYLGDIDAPVKRAMLN
jgi:hypothetical protein